jgi:hypothetical protein
MATWHMYTGSAFPHNQAELKKPIARSRGDRISLTTTVAILGGNSVVGSALEVLLQGLDYDTRLIEESSMGRPEELLAGTQLLLAAPSVNTESRERFLARMKSTPSTAAIPVLTLSTAQRADLPDQTGLVPWPCRLEDLKREIDAAVYDREEPAKPA